MKTYTEAQAAAKKATADKGALHIAADAGGNVWPRYSVIEAPKVGNKVSYAFNGDYYPDGEIVRISDTMKVITTSTGNRYYRRGLSAQWIQTGGTWILVQGHRSELNPSL
jgi:hypothetical protein